VEHRWNRVPAALAYDDNHLALAVLIASETAVAAPNGIAETDSRIAMR